MKNIKVALLTSTYNWPEALELILLSALRQTRIPDEIIIADDGSKEDTKNLIDSYRTRFNIPIIHEWIEDKGFRRSIILNKVIAKSKADYIVQVDGDCFLHSNFIEDHINNVKENLYLYGTRAHIKQNRVAQVLKDKNINIHFFKKGLKKRLRILRMPFLVNFYKAKPTISPKFRGCNVSFWRKDFIAINGYNEKIEGWGREDSELIIRFHNNNISGKRLKFCGIVFHLDHNEESRSNFDKNDTIQNNTIERKIVFCKEGIDKYLNQKN